MYAITRRLDVLAPVLIDCNCSDRRNCCQREKGAYYGNYPHTVENAVAGFEFMTLKSDIVSTQFCLLFGEKLVGTRRAGDGRFYAILKDDDCTCGELVDLFPFADVQVGSNCEFGRRISAVAVGYGLAAVTVGLIALFAELVTATRPYSESEAGFLR